ncbi:MAG: DUF4350 domain-containing protein [Pseudonocardia sp.]
MTDTSLDPRARQVWRAARTPLLLGLFVVLAGVLLAASADRTTRGRLDPAAVDDSGSRAVVQLLREQGVAVDVVRTAAGIRRTGPGSTVLVPFPWRLGPAQLAAVQQSDADVVVVAPGPEALAALAPDVEIIALDEPVDVLDPSCDLPAARSAGRVELGGELYRAEGAALTCYPTDAGAALVQVRAGVDTDPAGAPSSADPRPAGPPPDARTVTVLGAPDVLTNGALAEEGNAALALGLLGANPRLLWFLPGPEGPPVGQERSLGELVAPGWWWGVAQLGVAAVLVALWRARRLGPVVAEPLPVVVRSAETVEGLARLYRRAGAREHAADALRAATRARLAPLLGLGRGDQDCAAALVAAVAARTGRPTTEVDTLLYGPAPLDDRLLVELADGLDACEGEVRRS